MAPRDAVSDMTLQSMVKALLESGMSQASIAEAIDTNQPTIFRAVHGVDIRYSTGKRIERLYLDVIHKKEVA